MGRKTRQQKRTARLRQEIEVLRAELKKSESVSQRVSESRKKAVRRPEADLKRTPIDTRPDLKKTGLLTAVSLVILALLALTKPHWPWLISKLPF